jgi:8-oxoguanine deaminase
MLRVGLAPCSLFSVSPELRETARIARSRQNVGLHSHLSETIEETNYSLQKWSRRPVEHAEALEWVGHDVWFAHMVHPNDAEIHRLAHTGTGVCHCPTSNMNLAMGISPVRSMLDAGVHVGLGVDGFASNDDGGLLNEVRQTMLLQRVGWPGFAAPAGRMPARAVLSLATKGGALMLGRDDVGSLEVGKAADLVAFRIDDAEHAGTAIDPIAAIVTCAPKKVWLSVINGRLVIDMGEFLGIDLADLVARHNDISRNLLRSAGLLG